MNKIKKLLLPAFGWLGLPALLFSQTTPNTMEPTIDLPPVLLELEDSMIETVETPLPASALPEMMEIEVPVPETETPQVDLSALLPDDPSLLLAGAEANEGFFVDLTLGTGSLAQTLAELTATYLNGSGLSLRLNAGHESSLFWNYLPMDRKGMDRSESILLDVDYRDAAYRELFDFKLTENQVWTQNRLSAPDSLTWRTLSLQNRSEHFFEEGLSVQTALTAETFLFSENYGDKTRNQSFLLPSVGLFLKRDRLWFSFNADYRLSGEIGAKTAVPAEGNHWVRLLMDFWIPLPHRIRLGGALGAAWSNDPAWREPTPTSVYTQDLFGFTLPFSLRLSGTPLQWLDFSLEGGFKAWEEDYDLLQKEISWMNFSRLQLGQGWYFNGRLTFPIQKKAAIETEIDYRKNHRLTVVEAASLQTGLMQLVQRPGEVLFLSAGVEVTPIEWVRLQLKWKGEVLSPEALITPEHRLDFDLHYKIPREWFGGTMRLRFDYYETARIPEWDLSCYFKIKEKYQIRLAATDLLAGIYGEKGRPGRGIFMKPGSALALLFQMSL